MENPKATEALIVDGKQMSIASAIYIFDQLSKAIVHGTESGNELVGVIRKYKLVITSKKRSKNYKKHHKIMRMALQ